MHWLHLCFVQGFGDTSCRTYLDCNPSSYTEGMLFGPVVQRICFWGAERVPDDIVVRHKKYLVFKHIYPSRSIKPPQVLLQTQPQRRETPIMYDYTVLFYYPTLCHHGPCDLLICRSPPSFCSVVTLHKGKRSMKIQLTCK